MDIKDLKELKALIQLCRKQGVTEFGLGNFACKLGPLPTRASSAQSEENDDENYQGETIDEKQIDKMVGMPIDPTDEQLMEWAATGRVPTRDELEKKASNG